MLQISDKPGSPYNFLDHSLHIPFTLQDIMLKAQTSINESGYYEVYINFLKTGGFAHQCWDNIQKDGVSKSIQSSQADFTIPIELYDKKTYCILQWYFKSPTSEEITFSFKANDAAKIWIKDDIHIALTVFCCETTTYKATFIQGNHYFFKVELQNTIGDGYFEVKWSSLSNPISSLSSSNLFGFTQALSNKSWSITPDSQKLTINQNIEENKVTYCPENCASCDILLDGTHKCITCTTEKYKISNWQCVCGDEYYLNPDSKQCESCPSLCNKCTYVTNSFICEECKENSVMNVGACECMSSYYKTAYDSCAPCDPLCISCDGPSLCSQCKENTSNDSGVCNCNPSFYRNYDDTCSICPEASITCELDVENVIHTSCIGNLKIINDECRCETGKVLDYSQWNCIDCPDLCSSCIVESGTYICEECVSNASQDGLGGCVCDEGYLGFSQYCKACSSNCMLCSDDFSCIECEYGYKLNAQACVCDEDEFYLRKGECLITKLELNIASLTNQISLEFSKILKHSLQSDELGFSVDSPDYSGSITFELSETVVNMNYDLLLKSSIPVQSTLSFILTFSEEVQDKYDNMLDPLVYHVSAELSIDEEHIYDPNQEESEDNQNKSDTTNDEIETKEMEDTTKTASGISLAIGSGISALNMHAEGIWMMINTLQIFSFMPLYSINIPPKMKGVCQGLLKLNIFPNFFSDYFIEREGPYYSKRTQDFGYTTSQFLLNAGKIMTFFFFNLATYALLKVLFFTLNAKISNERVKKIFKFIIRLFEWNYFVRFWIQAYLELTITAFINILKPSFTSNLLILNFASALIVFVIIM